MKNITRSTVAILAVSLLALAGCAKEEVVKKDEPVVQQQTVKQQAPQQQVPATAPATAKNSSDQSEASAAKASAAASLETVYFDFDRSDLRKDSRDALSKNAQTLLKTLVNAKIKIEGNCDERGSDEYNLALGERRAKSAAAYLITMGVKSNRISTISYGKEKPAVQGNNEAAWSKNRRDEFVIVK
jgi:peptidoglycan-associated lipoprotein